MTQADFALWLSNDFYREFADVKVVPSRLVPLGALTFGKRIFVRPEWDRQPWQFQYIILRHEREHLRQQKRIGLGSLWLGACLFALLYALVLPFGLAYFRWRWERVGYLESLQARRELGEKNPSAEEYIDSLSGKHYGWCWPNSWVRRYFDDHR